MNQKLTTAYYNTTNWINHNSPALLTGASIVLNGASILLAIKSAKLEEKQTKEYKNAIVDTHEKIRNGILSKEDGKKELHKEYLSLGKQYLKLYGPTALSFGLSATSAIAAHRIQKGRELVLAGAYASLQTAFDDYRKKVKEDVGEAKEFDIYNGTKEEKSEDGSQSKFRMMDDPGDYTYLFDEANANWTKDEHGNVTWLMTIQNNMNRELRRKRYLFLADVYAALGINLSTLPANKIWASRHVGWIYDPTDPELENFISFSISDKDGHIKSNRYEAMMHGASGIWLEFNPDGDILEGTDTNGKTFMGYAIKAGRC